MNPIPPSSRRQFLSRAACATALSSLAFRTASGAAPADAPRPMKMKLSFMTFVCPTWTMDKIATFAREAGYDGVEIRVDAKHRHDLSSASSAEVRRQTKKLFADEGVEIAAVATSVHLANPNPDKHQANLDSARANLDLAADLGAPVVRMFAGGGIPKLTPEAARQVAAAFDEVGEHAKGSSSCPILECGHDIIKAASEAGEVIRQVRTPNFGVLWNTSTMDDVTFDTLKERLRHFHVHDEVLQPGNTNLVGLARRVKGIGFQGFVSLEIIRNQDLPEDLLKQTAVELKRQIAEGSK